MRCASPRIIRYVGGLVGANGPTTMRTNGQRCIHSWTVEGNNSPFLFDPAPLALKYSYTAYKGGKNSRNDNAQEACHVTWAEHALGACSVRLPSGQPLETRMRPSFRRKVPARQRMFPTYRALVRSPTTGTSSSRFRLNTLRWPCSAAKRSACSTSVKTRQLSKYILPSSGSFHAPMMPS